jgi:hypothetical protein
LLAKADYLASVADRGAAVAAYATTEAKAAGSGAKMDLVFSQLRYIQCLCPWCSASVNPWLNQ